MAIVGVPKEIKQDGDRVAIAPSGVHALVERGHQVLIQKGAGLGSGISDAEYKHAGASIVDDPSEVYGGSQVVAKVKEPLPQEHGLIRPGQSIFTFFHFAASRELTEAMIESGATCVAYETLRDRNGRLPLLTPMSEVAGRMAVLEGAKCLERPSGGRGVLISGVPGVEPAKVVILGGGVVGLNAAKIAAGVGAQVAIFDVSPDRLRYLDDVLPPNVTTLYSNPFVIRKKVLQADLVIGAVLVAGAKAPVLVTREDVHRMKDGSVIVDVAVDQGGSVETCRPTTHTRPTFVEEGVVHYCVSNMPGAVARTSTFALTNATLPYLLVLASGGVKAFAALGSEPAEGVNVHRGRVCHRGVAEAFGLRLTPLADALAETVPVAGGLAR
ncbi:MAG: alanine dehydrogenase [Planctomycetes bacterium]|nr:alanine dehydrogenase [Planctomycetota bacterium]